MRGSYYPGRNAIYRTSRVVDHSLFEDVKRILNEKGMSYTVSHDSDGEHDWFFFTDNNYNRAVFALAYEEAKNGQV